MAVLDREHVCSLSPRPVWEMFWELSQIPRASKCEEKVIQWITDMCDARKLSYKTDKKGNLAVFRPGSGGGESAQAVIIQAHVDMVIEKNGDVQHDFGRDPIKLQMDGEWMKACGTTLGADNGIGVAAALVLLREDSSTTLPPIEFLFTVDEETGLTGAKALDTSQLGLTARRLINMDTEEWGEICIGCAGGGDTNLLLPVSFEKVPPSFTCVKVSVTGLKGGHSGCNIHEDRANAVKCVTDLCYSATLAESETRLVSISAGDKRNAIAREGEATIAVPEASTASVEQALKRCADGLTQAYQGCEDISVAVKRSALGDSECLNPNASSRLLRLLMMLPHGVIKNSHKMQGLVETSNNVASVKLEGDKARVVCTTRSSIGHRLQLTRATLAVIGESCGATVEQNEAYPGWDPSPSAGLVNVVKDLYKSQFNTDAKITAIHAGLECGILNDRLGGCLDMVSYGPTIHGAHSPDERVHVPSVAQFWDLTKALITVLAKDAA